MQCVNLLKKRSLETELESWSRQPKRVCLGAELQTAECPMETSLSLPASNQQPDCRQVGPVRTAALCCPRCLGGEPGHINHILGH
ncbi:uncharacterized protein [Centroberyx affinis]|uniref:uncharacterized protein n=1 Tax=Centroberyx affinis TaxID=166261 RepID=UPI003A5BA6F8